MNLRERISMYISVCSVQGCQFFGDATGQISVLNAKLSNQRWLLLKKKHTLSALKCINNFLFKSKFLRWDFVGWFRYPQREVWGLLLIQSAIFGCDLNLSMNPLNTTWSFKSKSPGSLPSRKEIKSYTLAKASTSARETWWIKLFDINSSLQTCMKQRNQRYSLCTVRPWAEEQRSSPGYTI